MNWFRKIFTFLKAHKIISAVAILALIGGGYWWYVSAHSTTGKVSYITQPVERGTIVESVTGSGQVSPENQLDLKSKVAANVVYVGAKNGQQVRAGTLLIAFDPSDAQKKVRDAQIALDNAKLSLEKLQQQGNVTIPQTKQQAQDNLAKAYNDEFNAISATFLDLPGIMTRLDDILFGNEISKNSQNIDYYTENYQPYTQQDIEKFSQYKENINTAYQDAKASYDKSFADYKTISRASDTATIESITNETYQTTQKISDAIKDAYNLIQFYEDTFTNYQLTVNPIANTQLASLNTDTGKVDTDLSNMLQSQSGIKNDKDAIASADLDLQTQDFSVQQNNISVQEAENTLSDAKDNMADYSIYAPFDGVIALVPLKLHDSASAGTTAVTLITHQSITEIPFNEVDVTKIKVGQKATLTFDAIDGLSIVGQVADIDTLGTVTQGVVNYNVKIIFDSQDSQVKPGMSVTASVITNVKQNVITVPNSAIKSSGNQPYVQILVNGKPQQQMVQTGLSNDTDTEITSGLNGGENVVTQTITTAAITSSASQGAIRIPGLTGGGGGFGGGGGVRVGGGGNNRAGN